MNGIAFLIAVMASGVDYGWQPAADGQLEYIIQIEPVTLLALGQGQDIVSQIDPYVRNIRRFRIRAGTDLVPRVGTPPRTPPQSVAAPPPQGVSLGWQPIEGRQREFIIQIAPGRLASLRTGAEIAGTIPAEAGEVNQIRILAGIARLPQQNAAIAGPAPGATQTNAGTIAPVAGQSAAGAPLAVPHATPNLKQGPLDPAAAAQNAYLQAQAQAAANNGLRAAQPATQPATQPTAQPATQARTQPTAQPQNTVPGNSATPAQPILGRQTLVNGGFQSTNTGNGTGGSGGVGGSGANASPINPATPALGPQRLVNGGFQPANTASGAGAAGQTAGAPDAGSSRSGAYLAAPAATTANPNTAPSLYGPQAPATAAQGNPGFTQPPRNTPTDIHPQNSPANVDPRYGGGAYGANVPAPTANGTTISDPRLQNPGVAAQRGPSGLTTPAISPPVETGGWQQSAAPAQGSAGVPGYSPQGYARGELPGNYLAPFQPGNATGNPTQPLARPTTQSPTGSPGYSPGYSSGAGGLFNTGYAGATPSHSGLATQDAQLTPDRVPVPPLGYAGGKRKASPMDFWNSLAETARDPSLAYLRDGYASGEKPWWPFSMAMLALFASIGGNLYMGWIAVGIYRRYLDVATYGDEEDRHGRREDRYERDEDRYERDEDRYERDEDEPDERDHRSDRRRRERSAIDAY